MVVGNKTKGRIPNGDLKKNKAHQIFWKKNISYINAHVRVHIKG